MARETLHLTTITVLLHLTLVVTTHLTLSHCVLDDERNTPLANLHCTTALHLTTHLVLSHHVVDDERSTSADASGAVNKDFAAAGHCVHHEFECRVPVPVCVFVCVCVCV